MDILESKISELTAQLEAQYELQRTADRKSRRSGDDLLQLQERLRNAESELAAGDAFRDGLRVDKERVSLLSFCDSSSIKLTLEHLYFIIEVFMMLICLCST